MERKEMTLLDKLHRVQSEVSQTKKSGHNKFSGYDYVTLNDVLEPIRPLLAELGVVFTQSIKSISNEFREVNGGYYTISDVTCVTSVVDVDNNTEMSVTSVGFSSDKNGDKAVYKATTGARKYGIALLFGLDWFGVEPEDSDYDDKRFDTRSTFKKESKPVEQSSQQATPLRSGSRLKSRHSSPVASPEPQQQVQKVEQPDYSNSDVPF